MDSKMKIATLVDEDGNTLSFGEPGIVKLYGSVNNAWHCIREIRFNPSDKMNLSRIRPCIYELAARLDDCKTFVMRRAPGIFNAILEEELNIRVWAMDGCPLDAFPQIKEQTEAAINREPKGCASCRGTEKILPAPVGDINSGLFQINLIEIQQKNCSLNSQEILLPFLEQKKDFIELEMICLHIPKWLHKENLEKLKIEITTEERNDGFCHAFIYRLNEPE
jgi:Fe-only nitrogenase accessory protein AnfO